MNKKTIFRLIILPVSAVLLFVSGCTSFDKELLQDPKQFEELEALKLEPGIEPFDLRIDVVRRTRTEEAAAVTEARSMTVELPVSPIGFHIGNGLFIDSNFNVCLDVLELYGLDPLSDFTIQRTFSNAMVKPMLFKKEGDSFELTAGKSGATKIEAEFKEGAIEVVRNPGSNYDIEREDETLAVVPSSVLSGLEKHTISGEEGEFTLKKPLKKIYITENDSELSFGNILSVSKKGDMVVIDFESGERYHLVRVGEDIYFFDKAYIGFRITKSGNTFSINEKGREHSQFVLE